MEIIRDHKKNFDSLVVAIGNFDGIHLGHQKLIYQTIKISKEKQYIPGLITFYPHPQNYFSKSGHKFNILNFKSKMNIIAKLGIMKSVILRFNDKTANLSASDFFYNLVENFSVKHIVVGFNFKFGKGRLGDTELLADFSKKSNIGLSVVEQFKVKDLTCSSSKFREYITNSEFDSAKLISGREYFIEGRVIHGSKVGAKLGYPTANIKIKNLLTPKPGVYKSVVDVDGVEYKAISNIGVRPTIGKNEKLLESNLFNFKDNLYGKKIRVKFLDFIREEQKFESLESLKLQIDKDILKAQ